MTRNVLIMAGGTGGHIFPGLAIASELIRRGWTANWLGSRGGMEEQLVAQHNIDCKVIEVSGIRGKGVIKMLKAPFLIAKAVWQARRKIKQLNPDLVVGFGGFASGPGGLAARLLGKPLVIHEQNAIAGMTNKTLAKIANKTLVAFDGALENAITVGNPVRSEFVCANRKTAQSEPCQILVVGGSRGAIAVNKLMPKLVTSLEQLVAIAVTHQVGKDREQEVRADYQNNQVKSDVRVVEFIDDMAAEYQCADLVICRAGASTVSELATSGKAAVFIPFPYAVDDHQTKNAEYLVKNGAAICIQEKDLDVKHLTNELVELIKNNKTIEMGNLALAMTHKDATKKISDICEELVSE